MTLPLPYPYIPDAMLRADGNLDYLGFIRLLTQLWEDSTGYDSGGHASIPLRASGTDEVNPDYPGITYSLEMRSPFVNEPKQRIREQFDYVDREDDSNNSTIVKGQRFVNIIKFTVIAQTNPEGVRQAEEIIELFEDFMLSYTPIFKRLGISDIFYERRFSDSEENRRPGQGIIRRSVGYRVHLERVVSVEVWRILSAEVTARVLTTQDYQNYVSNSPTGDIDFLFPEGFIDSDRNWRPNQFQGRHITVTSTDATPVSHSAVIASNTMNTIMLTDPWLFWGFTPQVGWTYVIDQTIPVDIQDFFQSETPPL